MLEGWGCSSNPDAARLREWAGDNDNVKAAVKHPCGVATPCVETEAATATPFVATWAAEPCGAATPCVETEVEAAAPFVATWAATAETEVAMAADSNGDSSRNSRNSSSNSSSTSRDSTSRDSSSTSKDSSGNSSSTSRDSSSTSRDSINSSSNNSSNRRDAGAMPERCWSDAGTMLERS